MFTLVILCLAIDILEYVLNWREHWGQTAANQRLVSWCIDCYGFMTYTRMTIATYKIGRLKGPLNCPTTTRIPFILHLRAAYSLPMQLSIHFKNASPTSPFVVPMPMQKERWGQHMRCLQGLVLQFFAEKSAGLQVLWMFQGGNDWWIRVMWSKNWPVSVQAIHRRRKMLRMWTRIPLPQISRHIRMQR